MSSTAQSPTLRQSLALVWRSLRSMRTALILLMLLALASIAGTLVPQQGTSPLTVAQMFRQHPLRATIYNALGLFDVFGSWWFTLIYVLLLVSLVACLGPRTRALIRSLRSKPQAVRELDSLPQYAERRVGGSPEEAVEVARKVLRRKLYRVRVVEPDVLAADKGTAREIGSLVFHWSFFLILLGVIYGKGTGYVGFAAITEGKCWVDAAVNYDGNIKFGRFVGPEANSGTQICVRKFEAPFWPSGVPKDFVTTATFSDAQGRLLGEREIRVNKPIQLGGITAFQNAYGWAPVVQVRAGGRLIASGPLQFENRPGPKGVPQLALPWYGALRLRSIVPQRGFELVLWPDSRAFYEIASGGQAPIMTQMYNPLMLYRGYIGDLNSERIPRAARLDTRGLTKWTTGVVGAGQTIDLRTGKVVEPDRNGTIEYPDGLSLTFSNLRQYTVLQVSRDRGVGLVLVAAIVLMLGLLASLYVFRRKVWVRVRRVDGDTVVRVGGYALQGTDRFEEEFRRLVDEITPGSAHPAPEPHEKVGSR